MTSQTLSITPQESGVQADAGEWRKTACILCESNCGIEVRLGGEGGRRFERIRGNKEHVSSKGYTCEKALRLDHYQNHAARLSTPLRRRPDGSHEEISWETAIDEIAGRLAAVRDEFGGDKIFTYGGGGQGNHLGGAYGRAVASALGVRYRSNALAQEKTGEAFVEGKLYRTHTRADVEHGEVVVFLGKNPWQSHSFPEARRTLKEIAGDPLRTMVVIDPRRTETADIADIHLQVRPGTDAFCLAAILAVMVRDDLLDHDFIDAHVTGADAVYAALGQISIQDFADRCDIAIGDIENVAHRIGAAATVAIYEDLGIEQGPNSTLSSYLQRLIWILRGSFAKQGGMNPHSTILKLGGGGSGGAPRTTPVTGAAIIMGLIPANSIADEVLTDHPDRLRAMIIESSNPAHSLADSQRFRQAMEACDITVVIDVAMTETARHADYVLPASSQYEKPEAVFFNFEFPDNAFTLRRPVLSPIPGTLSEPEIHTRLVEALGIYDPADLEPLHTAAAAGRAAFSAAFFELMAERPELATVGACILYRTLGPTLGDGMAEAAALWFLCHMTAGAYPQQVARAGHHPTGELTAGDALFDAILDGDDGVVFTRHLHDEAWDLVPGADNTINVDIDTLLAKLRDLRNQPVSYATAEYPFILSAGERRSFTANAIYRTPEWRKRDRHGALAIHPADAQQLGIGDGDTVQLTTRGGTAQPVVKLDDRMRPGYISLPNGMGLDHPDETGNLTRIGIAPNDLTTTDWKDDIAGTPWHKHIPARLTPTTTGAERVMP